MSWSIGILIRIVYYSLGVLYCHSEPTILGPSFLKLLWLSQLNRQVSWYLYSLLRDTNTQGVAERCRAWIGLNSHRSSLRRTWHHYHITITHCSPSKGPFSGNLKSSQRTTWHQREHSGNIVTTALNHSPLQLSLSSDRTSGWGQVQWKLPTSFTHSWLQPPLSYSHSLISKIK